MRHRPKILIIGPTPPPYHGVAVSTKLILQAPAMQQFHLLHLDTADRRSIENIGKFDISNILIGLWHALTFLGMVIRHRPNLIYLPVSQGTAGFLRDAAFLLPAIWLGIATVIHLRGSEFPRFYGRSSPLLRALIRYTLGRVQHAIVLGQNLRGIFGDLIPPERISVVPNGTNDFWIETPKSPHKVRGLYLSNLRVRKGFLVTLEAVVSALHHFPNLEFTFAGPPESPQVQQKIEECLQDATLTDRLHFLGTVSGPDKYHLLLSSDFMVFPPIEPEGHPRVILEGMVAGLPIITTNQGAIAESVLDEQTGFLVPPGDAAAILNKIELLLEQPVLRQQMGQAARQRFLTQFTANIAHERLAAVLQKQVSSSQYPVSSTQ